MKKNGTDNVIRSFGEVIDKLENHREGVITDCDIAERKEHSMFLMPDFLLEYSSSEETLDVAIRARNVKDEEEKKELEKRLKRKLLPYKRKRTEELEKVFASLEKRLSEMLDTTEELKRGGDEEKNREKVEEYEAKTREEPKTNERGPKDINDELREEFAPARNWRNKHFKRVARRVREGKYPIQSPHSKPTVLDSLSKSVKRSKPENSNSLTFSAPNVPTVIIGGKQRGKT
jgi:hypothetical protein